MFWSIGRIPQAKKPALLLLLLNLIKICIKIPKMQVCPSEKVTLPVSLSKTIFLNQPVNTLWSQPAELHLQEDVPIMNQLPPRASNPTRYEHLHLSLSLVIYCMAKLMSLDEITDKFNRLFRWRRWACLVKSGLTFQTAKGYSGRTFQLPKEWRKIFNWSK
jgi:hypothetical protein